MANIEAIPGSVAERKKKRVGNALKIGGRFLAGTGLVLALLGGNVDNGNTKGIEQTSGQAGQPTDDFVMNMSYSQMNDREQAIADLLGLRGNQKSLTDQEMQRGIESVMDRLEG